MWIVGIMWNQNSIQLIFFLRASDSLNLLTVTYGLKDHQHLVFKNDKFLMNTSINSKNDLKSNSVDLKFMNMEKYCNYSKMLIVTASVLRFINNLKGRSKKTNTNLSTFVTKHEWDLGEHLWVIYIQKDDFTDVVCRYP